MRVSQFFALVGTVIALSTPLRAQDSKPGGLNKVAHTVSDASKTVGRAGKQDVKLVASRAHTSLRKAGNATKSTLKRTTGITSQSSHPGGLNKIARNVSRTSKTAASRMKTAVRTTKSSAHRGLTTAGKKTKAAIKRPPRG